MSQPTSIKVAYPTLEHTPFTAANNDLPTTAVKVEYEAYIYEGELHKYATLFDAESNNAWTEWDAPDWLNELADEMEAEHEPV